MFSALFRLVLPFLLLAPVVGFAQQYPAQQFAENRVDDNTHDTIMRTYWQVMERASLNRKLNTFYRISRINGELFLDLKVIEAGRPFVVPRDAKLKLLLDNGYLLILNNRNYQVSCTGCGARGFGGSSAQGAVLSFPISDWNRRQLLRYPIYKIGINTGEDYLEKKVMPAHSELFMDQLRFVYEAR